MSDDGAGNKRVAIIGISSILLVAMVIAVTVGVNNNNGGDGGDPAGGGSNIAASKKAITAICQPADYRDSCEQSLEKSAPNVTDPKELVKIAFTIAQKSIAEAVVKSGALKELDKDPRTHEAIVTCKELMNMSIVELQDCLDKVTEDFDFSRLDNFMADLTTWLSAAMTYQETCLDGFTNVSTEAGDKMRKFMNTSMELTTNGLDIVTGLNSLFSSFNPSEAGIGRRLLTSSDGSVINLPVLGHGRNPYPTWVPERFRRLLEDSDDTSKNDDHKEDSDDETEKEKKKKDDDDDDEDSKKKDSEDDDKKKDDDDEDSKKKDDEDDDDKKKKDDDDDEDSKKKDDDDDDKKKKDDDDEDSKKKDDDDEDSKKKDDDDDEDSKKKDDDDDEDSKKKGDDDKEDSDDETEEEERKDDKGKKKKDFSKAPSEIADVTVAKDGSGDYESINDALEDLEKKRKKKKKKDVGEVIVMYIKKGTYKEYVQVKKKLDNLVMIGDGADKTIITGSKNFIDGVSTYHTCTVAVAADYFFAKNLKIENTAGAEKHQAVALRVSADFAVFYNCTFDGYQDTLYTHAKRQFYRDCTISGTIDYVFGDAAVVFQNCVFLIRKPMENQQCIVTAQGRKQRHQPSAIIIQNGTITAHPDMKDDRKNFKSYLGRPWKNFSRTVVMESYIDDLIDPEGWLPWMGTVGTKTCWYGEYGNYGPGADQSGRVKWQGIKKITPQHAVDFTPQRFIRSDPWVKATGIPYVSFMVRPSTSRRVDTELIE
ncbi:Putative pectinesterase/pectinesterase inhibitor 43 [Linum grandiflorum]